MQFAFIFDFDGVLVDTMSLHFEAYRGALEHVGVPLDRAQFYHLAGMTGREHIRYFAEKAGVAVDVDEVYEYKNKLQSGLLGKAQSIETNVELLRILRASGVKVAIASGSSRRSVQPAMEILGIEADAVITADDVIRGKPHPDLFLLSAEKLEISPRFCVVVEDSPVGVEAARAAGMKVFHFTDNRDDERPEGEAVESYGRSNKLMYRP